MQILTHALAFSCITHDPLHRFFKPERDKITRIATYLPRNFVPFRVVFKSYGEVASVVKFSEVRRSPRALFHGSCFRRRCNLTNKKRYDAAILETFLRIPFHTFECFMYALVVNPCVGSSFLVAGIASLGFDNEVAGQATALAMAVNLSCNVSSPSLLVSVRLP